MLSSQNASSPAGRSLRSSAVIETGLQLHGLLSFLLHSDDHFWEHSEGQLLLAQLPPSPLAEVCDPFIDKATTAAQPLRLPVLPWPIIISRIAHSHFRDTEETDFMPLPPNSVSPGQPPAQNPAGYPISKANKNLATGTGLSWAGGQRPVRF